MTHPGDTLVAPLTRADRSFCRKWLRAFQKNQERGELILDWLRALRGPENRELLKRRGIFREHWATAAMVGITSIQLPTIFDLTKDDPTELTPESGPSWTYCPPKRYLYPEFA